MDRPHYEGKTMQWSKCYLLNYSSNMYDTTVAYAFSYMPSSTLRVSADGGAYLEPCRWLAFVSGHQKWIQTQSSNS